MGLGLATAASLFRKHPHYGACRIPRERLGTCFDDNVEHSPVEFIWPVWHYEFISGRNLAEVIAEFLSSNPELWVTASLGDENLSHSGPKSLKDATGYTALGM